MEELLDSIDLNKAIAAVYFAVRILKHQKRVLSNNIESDSSLEERELGSRIIDFIISKEQKLLSDFDKKIVDKYIVYLSNYIETRTKGTNRKHVNTNLDLLNKWRNESVHNYTLREYNYTKPKIFISYQFDSQLALDIENFIRHLGIDVSNLNNVVDPRAALKNLIEKVSTVDMAIFIFENHQDKRIRQNLAFELGYFIGKLGAENLILFAESYSNIPSDLDGFSFLTLHNWKHNLVKSIDSAGIRFDKSKIQGL